MLTQRNGLPPGCKSVPLNDHSDLRDVDKAAQGCCSLSPSPSSGGCPWARLAGVDSCLSEPYCLWFQLLARAYWGEVELGLTSPNHRVSWARLREASRKNSVRPRVRIVVYEKDGEHSCWIAILSRNFVWNAVKKLHPALAHEFRWQSQSEAYSFTWHFGGNEALGLHRSVVLCEEFLCASSCAPATG